MLQYQLHFSYYIPLSIQLHININGPITIWKALISTPFYIVKVKCIVYWNYSSIWDKEKLLKQQSVVTWHCKLGQQEISWCSNELIDHATQFNWSAYNQNAEYILGR